MRDPLIEMSTELRYRIIREGERRAVPLRRVADLDGLIRQVSTSRVVMLGEASHGTHEFYEWRALITKELIQNYGFHFVAVEGDWPACAHVNDYIHGEEGTARATLGSFQRWPTWMWGNRETQNFVEWLRHFNLSRSSPRQAGFYGLDVYSLFESIDVVQGRLAKLDPHLAAVVRARYDCFAPFQRDEKSYAKSLLKIPAGCLQEVTANLTEMLRMRLTPSGTLSELDLCSLFDAQQNARIVANAERYYRTMVEGGEDCWNVRDCHMLETLDLLLDRHGAHAKAIVWAHNTHIGDHRGTDMVEQGQVNIGGLARERWGADNVSLVGFSTYCGEVTASRAWGGPIETMMVPPGQEGSLEDALHGVAEVMQIPAFYLDLRDTPEVFAERLGQRAIGVVYHPVYERFGNYVPTSLSRRYDALVFIDRTHALTPLDVVVDRRLIPETWPQGH